MEISIACSGESRLKGKQINNVITSLIGIHSFRLKSSSSCLKLIVVYWVLAGDIFTS